MASPQQRVALVLWAALLGLLLAAPQPWAATAACAGTSCASAAGPSENHEDTSILQVRSAGAAALNKSKVDAAASPASRKDDPCAVEQCEALPPPEEPGKNTGAALAKVGITGIKTLLKPIPGASLAIDAASALLDGGTSPAAWAVYQLQNSLVTMQDYLVCEMKKVMGAFAGQYMDQKDLHNYNVGMQSVQQKWFSKCPARACLNVTDVAGDKRNALRQGCCDPRPAESLKCKKASISDIEAGRALCTFTSPDYTGVCGTDRKCWGCVGREQIIKFTRQTINQYNEKDYTSGGNVLNKYTNVDAIIAYAKGSTFILLLYQTLVLLGAAGNVNQESVNFVATTVNWLDSKIAALRDEQARRWVVGNASTFSTVSDGVEIGPDYYTHAKECPGEYSPTTMPGYKVRYGCDAQSAVRYVRLAPDDSEACSGCLNSDPSKNVGNDPNSCRYTGCSGREYGGTCKEYTGDVSNFADKVESVKLGAGCEGVHFFDLADYRSEECKFSCPYGHKSRKCSSQERAYNKCMEKTTDNGYYVVGNTSLMGTWYSAPPEVAWHEFSSARVWTEGTVTNTETGCVCQALQPESAPQDFSRYCFMRSWQFWCTTKMCSHGVIPTLDDCRSINCKGWSESYGSFPAYSREVTSFDDAVSEAAQKLDDFYAEQLKDVIDLVNAMKDYMLAGGVAADLVDAWVDAYPPSDHCTVPQLVN